MSDLVKRLRDRGYSKHLLKLRSEAADEIERLEAKVAALEEASLKAVDATGDLALLIVEKIVNEAVTGESCGHAKIRVTSVGELDPPEEGSDE